MRKPILPQVQTHSARIFYALFSAVMLLIMYNVIFNNSEYNYPIAPLILLTAAALAVFMIAFIFIEKYANFIERHYSKILLIFSVTMLAIQIIFGIMLEFKPAYDMSAIYDGAIEWMNTGTFSKKYDYMYYFPNNLGAMAFLKFFFTIARFFGITNYFIVGIIINSVMSVSAMIVTSLVIKHLAGHSRAVFGLLLFALSLPFYFIGAVFYTDSLSMLFPVLMYYMYILIRESESNTKRILYAFLFGAAAFIGMIIKFTVVIILIAIAIECILRFDFSNLKSHLSFKKTLVTRVIPIVSAIAVLFVFYASFNTLIYTKHLDRERAERQNTPYIHWIMMGMKNDGRYSPNDYKFTRSFDDPAERDKQIRAEISNRINSKGFKGMCQLFSAKSVVCFGDGTYALSDFLDDTPKHKTAIHNFILYKSENYKTYSLICSAVLLSIYILVLASALRRLLKDKRNMTLSIAPFIAFFGIWMFLMLWETNGRYFSNFIPIIFICAAFGIKQLNIKGAVKIVRGTKRNLKNIKGCFDNALY